MFSFICIMTKIKFSHKILLLALLIVVPALLFTSCKTGSKAGKSKRCDCPKWSYNQTQSLQGTAVYEKI